MDALNTDPAPGTLPPATTDAGESAPPPPVNTHFALHHKVFEVPGAVFKMDRINRTVALHMQLGGVAASIEINQIIKTFGIEPDSEDGRMLKTIEKSLTFVREIRPGDSIPNELLDGTASWAIEPRHLEKARSKLLVQLVSWMTEGNSAIDNSVDVLKLINTPEVKEKINDAFGAAARHLGLKEVDKELVIAMIGQLANELAYIEALRDKLVGYLVIKKKLKELSAVYRTDRRVGETIDRTSTLITQPFTKLREQFQLVDAQTAEVLSSLRRLAATVQFLRGVRDSMREFVLLWHDLDALWIDLRVERGPTAEALVTRTYRFAATYYSMTHRWALNVA
jgi:hypothetical protein